MKNKRVEYPFNNPDCPEFDTCFELKIAMSQKEKDDQKGEITKDVIFQTAGGSPLGVYPTLDDIKKAYATGEIDSIKGVYLSMDDGFWNYYDQKTNEWTKGKLYQATAVNPEDPTIIDLANKIQGNQDYIGTVEEEVFKHIDNSNAKFDIIDKRLENHDKEIAYLNDLAHETIIAKAEDKFEGNHYLIPETAEINGTQYTILNNQPFRISKVIGKTRNPNNIVSLDNTSNDGNISGVTWKKNNDGTITATGTAISTSYYNVVPDSKGQRALIKKGTYTISGNTQYPNKMELNLFDENNGGASIKTYVVVGDSGREKITFTIDHNMYYALIIVAYPNNPTNYTYKPMITPYPTNKPFEKNFKGLQNTTIKNITSVGTNRVPYPYYDKDKTEYGVTWKVNPDGTINASGTKAESTSYFFLVNNGRGNKKTLKAGTYTLSGTNANAPIFLELDLYDSDAGNPIAIHTITNEVLTKTFTIDHDMLFGLYYKAYGKTDVTLKPMLEPRKIATNYTPYVTDSTKDVNLTLKGAREVGDVALLTKTEGTDLFQIDITRNVIEVNLGDYNWTKSSANEWKTNDISSLITPAKDNNVLGNMICSDYDTITADDAYLNTKEGIGENIIGGIAIYDTSKLSLTPQEFKNAMNGVKLVFELKEPKQEAPIKELSLEDISVLGQLGGAIDVNPIAPNIVEPKETYIEFDVNYWEKPQRGNL